MCSAIPGTGQAEGGILNSQCDITEGVYLADFPTWSKIKIAAAQELQFLEVFMKSEADGKQVLG